MGLCAAAFCVQKRERLKEAEYEKEVLARGDIGRRVDPAAGRSGAGKREYLRAQLDDQRRQHAHLRDLRRDGTLLRRFGDLHGAGGVLFLRRGIRRGTAVTIYTASSTAAALAADSGARKSTARKIRVRCPS